MLVHMLTIKIIFTFTFVSLTIKSVLNKNLPAFIKKCQISDPNECLDTAIMDAARKLTGGDKNLGIPRLEPFYLKEVTLVNYPKGTTTVDQTYRNVYLYGMTNATIKNTDANFTDDNCYWNFDSYTPFLRAEADYELEGRILIFPISGQGKSNHSMIDINVRFEYMCEKYIRKNTTHIRLLDNFHVKINPKKVIFDYDNIIDGNELLSREVVNALNENALSFFADVCTALEESVGTIWLKTVNGLFSRLSEDQLFEYD